VGAVIFGIIPEKDKVVTLCKTILEIRLLGTGIDLFMHLLCLFDHFVLNIVHASIRLARGKGRKPHQLVRFPDTIKIITASVYARRLVHPYHLRIA